MNWDRTNADQVISNIKRMADQIEQQPINESAPLFHTKETLVHLIKIGAYNIDDITWVSKEVRNEIAALAGL